MWFDSSKGLIDGTKASRYGAYIFTCLWYRKIVPVTQWFYMVYFEVSNACICMFVAWLEFFLMSTAEEWRRRGTCLQYEEYNFLEYFQYVVQPLW